MARLKNAPQRLQPTETILAILLTLAAGYVDAIGFLKLDGIYVANMSGNSVAIGIHLARRDWPSVLERLLPVTCYVAGLLGTRILVNIAVVMRFRSFAAVSLVIETVFLLLFLRSGGLNTGIVFATLAMGIQAATVTRFNGVTVHTAFVTGSLIRLAETVSEWLMSALQGDRETAAQSSRDAIRFLGVWLAYVGGAALGAWLFTRLGTQVIIAACLLIVGLAIPDLVHPTDFDPRT